MALGILAGLITGALWGLTFIAPRAVQPYSEIDLAIARYGVFCLASAGLMLHPRFRPRSISAHKTLLALGLGAFGYVGNFLACAYAVNYAGGTIPPMIIGIVPVAMAAIGNRGDDGIPWRSLAIPLTLIAAGVLMVNLWRLTGSHVEQSREDVIIGVAWAVIGLVIWVAYGVVNSIAMRSGTSPDTYQWTGLQGLGAGLGILPLIAIGALHGDVGQNLMAASGSAALTFAVWAIVLGTAGSWGATLCWAVASHRLPLALAAQLIVSETVFGLIYGFIYEARWPVFVEMLGIGLELAGVIAAIRIFTSRKVENNEVVSAPMAASRD